MNYNEAIKNLSKVFDRGYEKVDNKKLEKIKEDNCNFISYMSDVSFRDLGLIKRKDGSFNFFIISFGPGDPIITLGNNILDPRLIYLSKGEKFTSQTLPHRIPIPDAIVEEHEIALKEKGLIVDGERVFSMELFNKLKKYLHRIYMEEFLENMMIYDNEEEMIKELRECFNKNKNDGGV